MGNTESNLGTKSTKKIPFSDSELDYKDRKNTKKAKKELYDLFLQDKIIHSEKYDDILKKNNILDNQNKILSKEVEYCKSLIENQKSLTDKLEQDKLKFCKKLFKYKTNISYLKQQLKENTSPKRSGFSPSKNKKQHDDPDIEENDTDTETDTDTEIDNNQTENNENETDEDTDNEDKHDNDDNVDKHDNHDNDKYTKQNENDIDNDTDSDTDTEEEKTAIKEQENQQTNKQLFLKLKEKNSQKFQNTIDHLQKLIDDYKNKKIDKIPISALKSNKISKNNKNKMSFDN